MKHITLLLLALFSAATLHAQEKSVGDVPEWFFRPAIGEYVGVSFPLEDSVLAKKQALYTAFLSYYAQQDIEGELKKSVMSFKNSDSCGLVMEDFLLLSLPSLNYNIIKTARNKYGEVFVLIKIISKSNSKLDVDYSYHSRSISNMDNLSDFNLSFQILFKLRDNTDFQINGISTGNLEQKGTDNDFSEILTNNMTTENIDYKNISMENFESSYGRSEDSIDYYYKDKIQVNMDELSVSYSLKNSLGAAYLEALFNLLTEANFWTDKNSIENPKMVTETDGSIYTKRNATRIGGISIRDENTSGVLVIHGF